MGQNTLQFFADRVEGNLLAAHQEIQKLALLYGPGELSFEQIESAVLNVARYDVFKLSEAVLGGQMQRVQRMLDGLQAEGEAAVLVHWNLAEDIRAMRRVQEATANGKPLPMALRENRIWGTKEMLLTRVLPSSGRRGQGPEAPRLARRPLGCAASTRHAAVRTVHARARNPSGLRHHCAYSVATETWGQSTPMKLSITVCVYCNTR
jgi:hypothetical protein